MTEPRVFLDQKGKRRARIAGHDSGIVPQSMDLAEGVLEIFRAPVHGEGATA